MTVKNLPPFRTEEADSPIQGIVKDSTSNWAELANLNRSYVGGASAEKEPCFVEYRRAGAGGSTFLPCSFNGHVSKRP
jgi:hypothetical protein